MKLYFLLIAIAISITGYSQLSTGLVAHWDFGGNANDISGNGHNGTPSNITYTSGKTGIANSAAKFDGSSSYITIPYHSTLM